MQKEIAELLETRESTDDLKVRRLQVRGGNYFELSGLIGQAICSFAGYEVAVVIVPLRRLDGDRG